MRIISYILFILLLLIGVSFACLNRQEVTVNYFVDVAHLPLCLLLVVVFALGGILGLFAAGIALMRHKVENIALKYKLKKLEKFS
jgi:putative membrane protein